MENTIKCPKCGESFELSEAFIHQMEDKALEQLTNQHKEDLLRVKEESERKIQEKISKELKDKDEQIIEFKQRAEKAESEELKIRKEKRDLEDAKSKFELEKQRQLDEEREKIKSSAIQEIEEKDKFKFAEYEKRISDMDKALVEARRKGSQGSQQLQGEVLELELENTLKREFPNDQIEPVEKGVKGADVRQIVKSPKGVLCGVILWETKRGKSWSDSWIAKLKNDLRAEKANIPVVITNIMPKDISSGMGQRDGVIVVSFNLYLPLAYLLRKNLLDVGFQIAKTTHSGEKKDYLFEFITSHEFLQQVEAMVEVYREMKSQVLKEREAYEKIWKVRESQADRLMSSTINIVGGIQGKIGQASLQIKGLDLLESGEKSDSEVEKS